MPEMERITISVGGEHELPLGVQVVANKVTGDGWVINQGTNGHLSGSVVWHRAEDTVAGRKHKRNVLSLDSALLQVNEVMDSASDEANRISGLGAGADVSNSSELHKLRETRRLLTEWTELTDGQKFDIKSVFHGIETVRVRARNPHNVSAGERAGRMKDLKDGTGRENPGAILAMSHPEEKDLVSRARQIFREVIATNDSRYIQVVDWILTEQGHLARADDRLEALANQPNDRDLFADLCTTVSFVKFRIHAFNQLAYTITSTNKRIEDESVVRVAQRGMAFDQSRGDLMKPFRQLGALPIGVLSEGYSQAATEHLPEIDTVIAKLGETSIGGPYAVVVDRLTDTAHQTADTLRGKHDASKLHKLAKKFNWLATYYCLPGDEHYREWYSRQLYGQRFGIASRRRSK